MTAQVADNLPAGKQEPEYPPESHSSLYRIRRKLAGILLNRLHPRPVREVSNELTLGGWIQAVRNETHLTEKDLAAALNTSTEFIEQLSSNEFLPWSMPPILTADVLCLFRLHIHALTKLAYSSSVCRDVGRGADQPAELMSWLAEVNSELTKRGSLELLEN